MSSAKNKLDKTCFISNENSLILMSILSSLFVADDIHDDYNEQLYKYLIDYLKQGISNPYY